MVAVVFFADMSTDEHGGIKMSQTGPESLNHEE